MSAPLILPALESDARLLAPRMNAEDAAEIWAGAHLSPLDGLLGSLRHSIGAWTWSIEGVPAAMFGVTAPSLMAPVGHPWLLTGDLVRRNPITFLRRYREQLGVMLAMFPRLENYVDARHAVCIRWLRWAGFEIGEAEPFGIDGLPFHKFSIGGG